MQNATQSNGTNRKKEKTAHQPATLALNANSSINDNTKQSPTVKLYERSITAQKAKPNKTNANKTKVGKSNAGKRRTRGSQTNASFLQMPKACWAPASFFFPPIATSG
jgi:hypothetical protein